MSDPSTPTPTPTPVTPILNVVPSNLRFEIIRIVDDVLTVAVGAGAALSGLAAVDPGAHIPGFTTLTVTVAAAAVTAAVKFLGRLGFKPKTPAK